MMGYLIVLHCQSILFVLLRQLSELIGCPMVMHEILPNVQLNLRRSASMHSAKSLVPNRSSALSLTCFIIPLYSFGVASKNVALAHGSSSCLHVHLA